MGRRIQYFDIIKGLAMFSVVNWHLMNNMGESGSSLSQHSSFIYQLLGFIQLPLFMFVSGFFCYKAIDGRKYEYPNIVKRANQLLLPLIFAGLIWIISRKYSNGEPFGNLVLTYITGHNPFYFLPCVFILCCCYSGLILLLRRSIWLGATAMCAVFIGLYISINFLPEIIVETLFLKSIVYMFFVPFMIGILCARYKPQWEAAIDNKRTITIIFITDVALFYILNVADKAWMPPFMGFALIQVQAFLLIQTILILAKKWERTILSPNHSAISFRLFEFMSLIGRNSLYIYILHYFFRFNLSGTHQLLAYTSYSSVAILLITIPISIIIIAASMVVKNCIAASPLLERVILGKV